MKVVDVPDIASVVRLFGFMGHKVREAPRLTE
jgi:hypothetical protein